MLLNKKIKLLLIFSILLIILPIVYSQQTCTASEIKDALRKALFEYFEAPTDSKLSVNEIKDFLHFYISTDVNQLTVDCSGSGPLSGKPYYLMLGAARNIQRGIPTCADGTEYGKCSANVPNYCYGGKLEERCKICGCGANQQCDSATNKCVPSKGQGTLVLALTDARVEGLKEVNVEIAEVEVHKDNTWISFAPEKKKFKLLSLADAADVIGSKQLAPGKYTQIRFQVISANIKLADGTIADVKIPSGEIKLVREFEIEEGKTTNLYVDFDAESVVKAGSQYILQPVVNLRTKEEFKEDLCENKAKCNDRNPCTEDSCGEGFCSYNVLPDGTSCGTGKICIAGTCISEKSCRGSQCAVDPKDPCAKLNFETIGYNVEFPLPGYLYDIEFVDLDSDGDLDLATGGIDMKVLEEVSRIYGSSGYLTRTFDVSPYAVRIFLNDGKGNFVYSGQYIGAEYTEIDIGDIDGDGDKDILTGNSNWIDADNIFFNDGKGRFTASSQRIGGLSNFKPKLADLDKDGDLDVYFVHGWRDTTETGRVFLNDGKGYFTEKFDTGLISGAIWGAALFDSDKDGDTDLVEVGYIQDETGYILNLTQKIYKNDGTAKFTLTQDLMNYAGWANIAAADVDKDGDIDFVSGVGVHKNDGKGYFTHNPGGATYFEAPFGDADNDKDLDMTTGHSIGANDGTGNFYGCSLWFSGGLYPPDSKFGDVDGDGDVDMAVSYYDYTYNYTTSRYTIIGSVLKVYKNLIR